VLQTSVLRRRDTFSGGNRKENYGNKNGTDLYEKHYSRRKAIIEPVFGWIKENRGTRKLQRRGLVQCAHEWKLICTTQNLRSVMTRCWWSKLKSAIMVMKNKIFDEDTGPLSGLIDLCPGSISFRGISLTRITLFVG